MMRRFLTVTTLATILCTLPVVHALAQVYPSKTVSIVVPYPPGGATDNIARSLARDLSELWGQSVVVQNVPGGGTIIGANKVVTAPPDGYTLLLTLDNTVVSNRFLYKKLPYDPDKSLAPITMIARAGQMVIANPSLPANNLRELVESARRAPGKIAYASYGIGTQPNLLFETIGKREGVKFLHVPYKGVVEEMTAVMTGQVQISLAPVASDGSMIRAGKLKALAIGGEKRSSLFSDVPTIAESGYPYASAVVWWGLFAPRGTSAQLVNLINRDVAVVTKRPDFAKYMIASDIDRIADTPAEFAASIRADVKSTAKMVKAAGIRPK